MLRAVRARGPRHRRTWDAQQPTVRAMVSDEASARNVLAGRLSAACRTGSLTP